MALARLNLPGVMLYGGSIAPGRFRGNDVTIQDVFEAVGAHAAGTMSDEDLAELELVASPGAGACGGQFTANTMAMAFEFLGISPMGSAMVPAEHASKADVAIEAGQLMMDVLERGLRPRDIITKDSLENAIAAIATSGGSTNGVLHLLAVAREAGVELDIDDFDRISERTPLLCDLKPGGRYVATDLYEAGGIELVAKRLLDAGLLHEDAITVTGRTIGEHAREADETEGQRVVRPLDDPIKATGGLAILRGNLAPDGCVVKLSGHERRLHTGPARVFEGEEAAMAAVVAGSIEQGDVIVIRDEGPAGGPGMREMLARHRGAQRRWAWASTSRCSPTGASAARRTASWPATSRPSRCAAARSPPSATATRSRSTSMPAASTSRSTTPTIAERVAAYGGNDNADLGGVLGKYAKLVSSASIGAITLSGRAPAAAAARTGLRRSAATRAVPMQIAADRTACDGSTLDGRTARPGRMRIAIDIDSTLHHYWDRLSAAALRRFGIDLPYEEQLDWGITRLRHDQLHLCIQETHCEEAILAGEPYPDAVETVRRWHDDGHFIHVTSHRDPQAPRRHGALAGADRRALRRPALLPRQGRPLRRARHRAADRRQPREPRRARSTTASSSRRSPTRGTASSVRRRTSSARPTGAGWRPSSTRCCAGAPGSRP